MVHVDESWTLQQVFERLADSTEGRDEGNQWTLDTTLRGLPLVYVQGGIVEKVRLSTKFSVTECGQCVGNWEELLACTVQLLFLTFPIGDFD